MSRSGVKLGLVNGLMNGSGMPGCPGHVQACGEGSVETVKSHERQGPVTV